MVISADLRGGKAETSWKGGGDVEAGGVRAGVDLGEKVVNFTNWN